ncbi:unnamed protein product, partial [Heterosigma akashiwo]
RAGTCTPPARTRPCACWTRGPAAWPTKSRRRTRARSRSSWPSWATRASWPAWA